MKREEFCLTKHTKNSYITYIDPYLITFTNDYFRNTCTCTVDFYEGNYRCNRVNQVIGNVMDLYALYQFMGLVYVSRDYVYKTYTIMFGTTYQYCIITQSPLVFGPNNKLLSYN